LGDSERLRLGETVIAIGNPLAEFDGSVTVGVVSGLNRARTYEGVRQGDLIQTDAAVNSGNSGGALLNLEGQLVGIPMSVLRESRGGAPVEGIAFALPINRALDIATQIIDSGGAIERPTLELDVVEITDGVRAQFPELAAEAGALVISIRMNGVGAQAGIQLADVIVEVDGLSVDAAHPLHSVLSGLEPGQPVQVVFNRDGRIIETEVILAKRS
jgi:S1-C subfamily serine protease